MDLWPAKQQEELARRTSDKRLVCLGFDEHYDIFEADTGATSHHPTCNRNDAEEVKVP